jgi:hypothetical protein
VPRAARHILTSKSLLLGYYPRIKSWTFCCRRYCGATLLYECPQKY